MENDEVCKDTSAESVLTNFSQRDDRKEEIGSSGRNTYGRNRPSHRLAKRLVSAPEQ
jgi:hypothetical protein